MKYIYLLLPLIGIILLDASFTSADLNDEISIRANTLKATTLSMSIQDTVDSSMKPYLFNLNKFQSDSLEATTVRIRNTGKENTKYHLKINQVTNSDVCQKMTLKVIKDENYVYSGNILDLNLNMPIIDSGEKNDLVLLLSLGETGKEQIAVPCEYQLIVSTTETPELKNRLFDVKKIGGKVEVIGEN
jgi:hypothetical protein